MFGTETNESLMPSKVKQTHKSNLGYTALKQFATNIKIALRWSECDKPRLVFSKKKPLTKILIKLKKDTADILSTCGTTVLEFVGNNKDMIEPDRGKP